MKKTLGLTVCAMAATVLLLLTGCLPTSLEPLYTEKDLVSNDGLVGRWSGKESSDKEVWEFTAAGEKQYKLVVTDDEGLKSEFEARLVKLADHLFLDLYPTEAALEKMETGGLYKIHLARLHGFFKLEIKDKQLDMYFFDLERLAKVVEEKPDLIAHRGNKDQLIFTASTEALQKFVLQQAGETNAFGEPGILVPAKPVQTTGDAAKPASEPEKTAPAEKK